VLSTKRHTRVEMYICDNSLLPSHLRFCQQTLPSQRNTGAVPYFRRANSDDTARGGVPSEQAMRAHRRSKGAALVLFNLDDRRGCVVNATTRPLYPRERRPGTHCTAGWVGPRGRSERVREISPPLGFDLRTVQPVASLYTDYTTSAHCDGMPFSECMNE
jgi:hypothetical protein